jgi:hypothetical protein
MNSYHYSRPVSPPLPDKYSGGYLPKMPTYSGASQSRDSSASQSRDSGASQSRDSGASQSRDSGASQSGGATGSSASQRTSSLSVPTRWYPEEEKYKMLSQWKASGLTRRAYSRSKGIPESTFGQWVREADDSYEAAEEKWSRLISEWQASGLSQRKFASKKGISRSCLNERANSKGAK